MCGACCKIEGGISSKCSPSDVLSDKPKKGCLCYLTIVCKSNQDVCPKPSPTPRPLNHTFILLKYHNVPSQFFTFYILSNPRHNALWPRPPLLVLRWRCATQPPNVHIYTTVPFSYTLRIITSPVSRCQPLNLFSFLVVHSPLRSFYLRLNIFSYLVTYSLTHPVPVLLTRLLSRSLSLTLKLLTAIVTHSPTLFAVPVVPLFTFLTLRSFVSPPRPRPWPFEARGLCGSRHSAYSAYCIF